MKTRTARALFAAIVAVAGRAAARLTDCGRGGRGIRGRGGREIRVSLFAAGVAVFSAVALPQAQAQSTDIAVLHNKVDHANLSIERMDDKFTNRLDRMDNRLDRMDGRFERIEANIVEIKENGARTDEKVSAMQMQNQFIVIPLLLLTLASLIGLLTKGHYWGVDRERKASSGARSGHSAQAAASPA